MRKIFTLRLIPLMVLLLLTNLAFSQDCAFNYNGPASSSEFQCSDALSLPSLSGGVILASLTDLNGIPFSGSGATLVWNIDPNTVLPNAVPAGTCDPIETVYEASVVPLSGCVLLPNVLDQLIFEHTVTVFPPASAFEIEILPAACGQIPMIVPTSNSCPIDVMYPNITNPSMASCPVGYNGTLEYMVVPQDLNNTCWSISGTEPIQACTNCIDCPDLINFTAFNDTAICSGDVVTFPDLSTFLDLSNGTPVTYNWLSETGTFANTPSITETFVNNNCDPEYVTYVYQVICSSGEILITGVVTAIVYPSDLTAFVNVEEDGCTVSVSIDDDCTGLINANLIFPNDSQFGQDSYTADVGESGIATFEISYDNTLFQYATECVAPYTVTGNYDCSSNCPAFTDPFVTTLIVCDGETVTLPNLAQGVSGGGVSFNWMSNLNNFSINTPTGTQVVTNTDCEPKTVTFSYSATCDYDGTLLGSGSFNVIVYPTDMSNFYVVDNSDVCNPVVTPTSDCVNFINVTEINPVIINPGDAGNVTFEIAYSNIAALNCISTVTEILPYNCVIDDCPVSNFSASNITVCSGETVQLPDLSANVVGSTSVLTYGWDVTNGIQTSLSTDSFLAINTDCAPLEETANYSIFCTINGQTEIIQTGSILITIYPTNVASFVTAINDGCTASFLVDAGCASYINTTTASTNAGQTNNVNITASFNNGNCNGSSLTENINLNCPVSCPTFIAATVSSSDVCGNGIVDFMVSVNPASFNNAYVELIDENNNVTQMIYNGFSGYTASASVSNTDCIPQVNAFNIVVRCLETFELIANTNRFVTVYPTSIMDFIDVTAIDGCSIVASVNPDCASVITNLNSSSFSATPGTSGIATFCFSYNNGNGGNCVNPQVCLNSSYNCADLGGGTGTGTETCPIATGVVPSVLETCGGSPLLLPNLSNIITSSNTLDLNNVSYQWFGPNGFTTSSSSTAVVAINNTCSTTTEIYSYTITCNITESVITSGSLSVIVYPGDISAYISTSSSNDGCTTFASVSAACGNNVVLSQTSQTGGTGTNGIHSYTASWNTGSGSACVTPIIVNASYSCASVFSSCPTNISGSASAFTVCNGDAISLIANSSNNSALSIIWYDGFGNQLVNPNNINVSNFGCDPVNVQYLMVATCLSDPSQVITDNVILSVYPNSIAPFVTLQNDGCNFGFIIQAGCEDNIQTTSYTADAGEVGTAIISANYISGGNCVPNYAQTVNINCAADEPEICSLTNTTYCAPPLTPITICIDCGGGQNLSITDIESLYFCSISNDEDGDACFNYTPLPNLDLYTNTDILTIDYCITGTNLCTTENIVVSLVGCTGVQNPTANQDAVEFHNMDNIQVSNASNLQLDNLTEINAAEVESNDNDLTERIGGILEDWTLYPNPTRGTVFIEFNETAVTENINIEVINSVGQTVVSKQFEANNDVQTVDVSNFENGVYFVILKQNDLVETKKLIVER